jgi:CarD family transcriptional regulator
MDMFQEGDKIIYPMYGAGIIEKVEEKESLEGLGKYYIIRIPNGNLRISLKADKSRLMGLRKIGGRKEIAETLCKVAGTTASHSENWNQRYKDNLEKMKTGQLFEVVEVVKSLYDREKTKGLSSNEKKLLSTGKRIVLSEIIYSYDIDLEKAEDLLANLVLNC